MTGTQTGGDVMEETVTVGSLEAHVETAGSGEPVVLIHGLGLSGAIWDRVRDALGPGYRLVAVDLRGAGRTRELAAKELTLGQLGGRPRRRGRRARARASRARRALAGGERRAQVRPRTA